MRLKRPIILQLEEFGNPQIFQPDRLTKLIPSVRTSKNLLGYLSSWVRVNKRYLEFVDVSVGPNTQEGVIQLKPGKRIGVVPLVDPLTKEIYGTLVVKSRFGWNDIYEIFEAVNWECPINLLKEQHPIASDFALPKWFAAIETLEVIDETLKFPLRGWEDKQTESSILTGTVDWHEWCTRYVPYGKYNIFPTELHDHTMDTSLHRQFKGVVKMILQDILAPGTPVRIRRKGLQLIKSLEQKLANVQEEPPSIQKLEKEKRHIPVLYRSPYQKAIQKCIDYLQRTYLEVGQHRGYPWSIEMDRLFEFWVEHWTHVFAIRTGSNFYSDIRRNSYIKFVRRNNWISMQLLRPDMIIEREDMAIVLEVKYKKHYVYLKKKIHTEEILEEHRHDMHQLISYLSALVSERKIGCLVYPSIDGKTHISSSTLMNYRGRVTNINILLCAVPFDPNALLSLLDSILSGTYYINK